MSSSAVRSMEHTGGSGDVAYYAERGRSGNYLKVEVTRSPELLRRRSHRTVFYLTISRHNVGQLLPTLRYMPQRTPRPGPLPAATITRILRQFNPDDLADPTGGGLR